MMEFAELAGIRQSVRSYSGKAVEEEKLMQCIETARLSPSANNSQPWRFVVVDEPELRDRIADAAAGMGMNKFVRQAPVIIAVVLEKQNMLSAVGSVIQDKEYRLLDIVIAANQLCLQAAALGLGTCMVGWFDENKVKRLLGVDKKRRIPLLITLGYSDTPVRQKVRKPFEEIYGRNRY